MRQLQFHHILKLPNVYNVAKSGQLPRFNREYQRDDGFLFRNDMHSVQFANEIREFLTVTRELISVANNIWLFIINEFEDFFILLNLKMDDIVFCVGIYCVDYCYKIFK